MKNTRFSNSHTHTRIHRKRQTYRSYTSSKYVDAWRQARCSQPQGEYRYIVLKSMCGKKVCERESLNGHKHLPEFRSTFLLRPAVMMPPVDWLHFWKQKRKSVNGQVMLFFYYYYREVLLCYCCRYTVCGRKMNGKNGREASPWYHLCAYLLIMPHLRMQQRRIRDECDFRSVWNVVANISEFCYKKGRQR